VGISHYLDSYAIGSDCLVHSYAIGNDPLYCQRFLLTKYGGNEVDVARYGRGRRGTNVSV